MASNHIHEIDRKVEEIWTLIEKAKQEDGASKNELRDVVKGCMGRMEDFLGMIDSNL